MSTGEIEELYQRISRRIEDLSTPGRAWNGWKMQDEVLRVLDEEFRAAVTPTPAPRKSAFKTSIHPPEKH